jgi:hypothetical protein
LALVERSAMSTVKLHHHAGSEQAQERRSGHRPAAGPMSLAEWRALHARGPAPEIARPAADALPIAAIRAVLTEFAAAGGAEPDALEAGQSLGEALARKHLREQRRWPSFRCRRRVP